jgi:hypothetical protein
LTATPFLEKPVISFGDCSKIAPRRIAIHTLSGTVPGRGYRRVSLPTKGSLEMTNKNAGKIEVELAVARPDNGGAGSELSDRDLDSIAAGGKAPPTGGGRTGAGVSAMRSGGRRRSLA